MAAPRNILNRNYYGESSFPYAFRIQIAGFGCGMVQKIDDWLDNHPSGLYTYSLHSFQDVFYYVVYFDTTYDAIHFKMDFGSSAILTAYADHAIKHRK